MNKHISNPKNLKSIVVTGIVFCVSFVVLLHAPVIKYCATIICIVVQKCRMKWPYTVLELLKPCVQSKHTNRQLNVWTKILVLQQLLLKYAIYNLCYTVLCLDTCHFMTISYVQAKLTSSIWNTISWLNSD